MDYGMRQDYGMHGLRNEDCHAELRMSPDVQPSIALLAQCGRPPTGWILLPVLENGDGDPSCFHIPRFQCRRLQIGRGDRVVGADIASAGGIIEEDNGGPRRRRTAGCELRWRNTRPRDLPVLEKGRSSQGRVDTEGIPGVPQSLLR